MTDTDYLLVERPTTVLLPELLSSPTWLFEHTRVAHEIPVENDRS
ncbi:hypothetical protein [Haladaptatus sp. W1]|nr:hypothetical protein [Haladaptatus sp. W1]